MNFTRDPIIETVITPKEGCKLVVRSSKAVHQEDYLVDALEVVSFGHAHFYRSQERPKSFLVPVGDYEVFESKEPKMILKNPVADRSIKIGGGKELQNKQVKEIPVNEIHEVASVNVDRPLQDRQDRKQKDKRRKGKRNRDRHEASYGPQESHDAAEAVLDESVDVSMEKPALNEEVKEKAPSFISKLFPPPPTLIKETLSRYKTVDPAIEDIVPQVTQVEEPVEEPKVDVSYDDMETTDFMDFRTSYDDSSEEEQ